MRERLWQQLGPYRAKHRDVRWLRSESWHLTLSFLGSVGEARVPELERLVDAAAASQPPYPVRASGGGGRIVRRDGVAWLALAEGATTLLALSRRIAEACPPDISDAGPPRPAPSAHLTVARRADRRLVSALQAAAHGPIDAGWTVDRLWLVRSNLERDGARYRTLHEATL